MFFFLFFFLPFTMTRDSKTLNMLTKESSVQCSRRQYLKSCENKRECRLTRQDVSSQTTDCTATVFLSDCCNGKRSKEPQKPQGVTIPLVNKQNKMAILCMLVSFVRTENINIIHTNSKNNNHCNPVIIKKVIMKDLRENRKFAIKSNAKAF